MAKNRLDLNVSLNIVYGHIIYGWDETPVTWEILQALASNGTLSLLTVQSEGFEQSVRVNLKQCSGKEMYA